MYVKRLIYVVMFERTGSIVDIRMNTPCSPGHYN